MPVSTENTFTDLFRTSEPDRLWEVIVRFSGNIERVAEELNVIVEVLYHGYAIITLERDKIPSLYVMPEIEHVELPKRLFAEKTYDLTSSCIVTVQDRGGYNLSGKGVIVAIIDSGIDYTHKDFQNDDGTTRIKYMWDQSTEGSPPQGFSSGTEYTEEDINNALADPNPFDIVPLNDYNGHGTAVAGIAVGNGKSSSENILGVAYEADIVVVKVGTKGYQSFARTTELMRAIKYVIEKAIELSQPLAINLSFGTNNGSHTGDSLFETYISDISSVWETVIVIPTGNEGSSGHHYEGQIKSKSIEEIDFFTAPGIESFYITLWKNFEDSLAFEMILPNGNSTGVVGVESQSKTVLDGNLSVTIVYGQPSRYSVNQEVFFNIVATSGTIRSGIWKIRVISDVIVSGGFNAWLPTSEEVTSETFFTVSSSYTTMTIPSTADRIICVAGYNDRLRTIAEFSGRGHLNLAMPNPDIAAPAVNIVSTKTGGGYDVFTGTSIAAPFVTGSAALMMQWGIVNQNDPFLYSERVRAFLRIGAMRDQRGVYPNSSYGYGTLCLSNTMSYLERYKSGSSVLWRQI